MINGLPEKLRDLRERDGFSQRTVAGRLNVSSSIISCYETGERTPSAEMLLALSRLYRCSTDYLLGRNTVNKTPSLDVDGLSTAQIQALSELIRTMREPAGPV